MIIINDLEKKFSSDFTLKIDELHIEKGERVAVIGANGSGKSTLLRLIAGAIKPDGGRIEISADKEKVGYQPQDAYVFKGTVESNILLGAKNKEGIDVILSDCMLENLRNKKTGKLSGGEKQRVCFARMLSGGYDLLMLDEPFSAADIEFSEKLTQILLRKCEENGTTLLMTTHLPSQAFGVATKVLIMNNGKIAEYCEISDLKEPKTDFGKKFITQWKI